MAFDPDKWLKENPAKKEAFDPDEYLGKKEEDKPGIGSELLDVGLSSLEAIDRVTAAPVRAGVGALLDEDPETGFFQAAGETFGAPSGTAPTGKELAQQAGISEDVLVEDVPLIGDVTKSGAAGLAAEIALDPFALIGGALKGAGKVAGAIKPVRIALKNRASRKAFKSIAQISTDAKVREVFKKSRKEIIGREILESDLGDYLNDPVKLLEKIQGKEGVEYVTKKLGKKRIDVPSKVRGGGIISDVSNETTDIINRVSKKIEPIDMDVIAKEIKSKDFRLRMEPGGNIDPKQSYKYDKTIDLYLKKPGKDRMHTLSELQDLKRGVGKKLSSKDFIKVESDAKMFEKAALQDIYHTLNRAIESSLDGIPVKFGDDIADAGVLVGANNQKVSSLMSVGEMLQNIPAKELRGADLSQQIIDLVGSGGAGVTAGAITGSPYVGVAAAGAYGAGTGAAKRLARKAPGFEANVINKFVEGQLGPGAKTIGAASAAHGATVLDRDPGRSPQSVNIPAELIRTPIPRDAARIIENKEFVKAKIAQQLPEMYEEFAELLDNNPEQVAAVLPALAQGAPQLFEVDPYNRIDGKVNNPQDKARASKDIMYKEDLSNTEKILMINKMNKTGELNI